MSSAVEAVEEEAARWLIRREEPGWSASDEDALECWLELSMAHRAAFWRLAEGWRQADRIAALGGDVMMPPRRRLVRSWSRTIRRLSQPALGAGIALTIAIAVGSLGWSYLPARHPVDGPVLSYATSIGHTKVVNLADGSRVQMNTATRLRVASGADPHEVWLDQGEAYFDIVHRPDRQFVVRAGTHTITVLGTRFTVRRDGARVTVAVLSGRVKVDGGKSPDGGGRATIVTTGDVAVAEPQATLVASDATARVEELTAWRSGKIVFEDTPLSEAIREINRYAAQPIRIEDPALAQLRIGGSIRSTDSEAFVSLLERAYGVHVTRDADEIRLRQ